MKQNILNGGTEMKKKGVITGLLFVVLLAFVFQTEIGGFLGSLKDKAQEAVNADTAALAEKENLPKTEEKESTTTTESEDNNAAAPPVPSNSGEASDDDAANEAATASDITYKEVSLFFVDEAAGEMAVEKRSVINGLGLAKATMEQLLTGPTESSLQSYIPEDTEILGINIEDSGLCTIDFSPEIQNADLNSAEEKYVLESIVDTLGQFDTVKAVQIKVNGNTVQSLTGHWDISQPLPVNN